MERISVKSSHIKSIGYDAQAEELEIEFFTGKVYRYPGFKVEHNEELQKVIEKGESVGWHFHKNIKPVFKGKVVE